jgi:hypothetical protein
LNGRRTIARSDDFDRAARAICGAVDDNLLDHGSDIAGGDEVDRIPATSEDPGTAGCEDGPADDPCPRLHVGGRSDDQGRHRRRAEVSLDGCLRPSEGERIGRRRIVNREQDEPPDTRRGGGPDEVPVPVAIDGRNPAGFAATEALDRRDDRIRAGDRRAEGAEPPHVAFHKLDAVGERTKGPPSERQIAGEHADRQAAPHEPCDNISAEEAGATGDEDHRVAPAGLATVGEPTLPRIDAPTSTAA